MAYNQAAKQRVARPGEAEVYMVEQSELFDGTWYTAQYPDVAMGNLSPAQHYLWVGARMLRDPSVHFSTRYYLEANEDVTEAGINPLVHYLRFGRSEGRSIGVG